MSTMEIVLLVAGFLIFIVSFFVPDKAKGNITVEVSQEEIDKMVQKRIDDAKNRLEIGFDVDIHEATERFEVSLDKLANEKMLAFGEYSEGLLAAIDNNHQEVIFLYNMLNDKAVDVKNIVREVAQQKKDVEENSYKAITAIANKDNAEVLGNVLDNGDTLSFKDEEEDKANMNLAIELNQLATRNKNENILELHRQNKSNIEIARELGLGMGEVKLVIDLFEDNKDKGVL